MNGSEAVTFKDNVGTRPDVNLVYNLSKEYLQHAYKRSNRVQNEVHLKQYYTLVSSSVKCLQYIKKNYQLTIEQDVTVTVDLVNILINETLNFELAENYLSTLKTRLQNHQVGLLKEKMICDYYLLYQLAMKRDTAYYYKIASRSCSQLVDYLNTLTSTGEVTKIWLPVFQYIDIALDMKLNKKQLVISKYNNLIQTVNFPDNSSRFEAFILLSYVNYLLKENHKIPLLVSDRLETLNWSNIGIKYEGWKLVTDLIKDIYRDENITNTLNKFKNFFRKLKEDTKNSMNSTQNTPVNSNIYFGDDFCLEVHFGVVFDENELKNILLLFQSVSFLVNCYDKRANFSTKFLPKVMTTTNNLLLSIINGEETTKDNLGYSLSVRDAKMDWYESILQISGFYKQLETLLIAGKLHKSGQAQEDMEFNNSFGIFANYINYQLNGENMGQSLEDYSNVINSHTTSPEIKMISLLNSYSIAINIKFSNENKLSIDKSLLDYNAIWEQIEKEIESSNLSENPIWDCSISILWVINHFEQFTNTILPSTDSEKNRYIGKLRVYYKSNKLIGSTPDYIKTLKEKGEFIKLKKGLLLQLLLNYIGGHLFEHDLNLICKISELCFHIAKEQELSNIRYIIGLWHLKNCTSAMKSKDVTITKAKLESIVRDISEK